MSSQTTLSFEIISFQFNSDVSLSEQKKLLEALNQIVKSFEGFISRDYYYSQDNGRWIDHVVWSSEKQKELTVV